NKERIFLRKEQCCFGWDWAPDLPGYGIWDDVILSYRPVCAINDVRYKADVKGRVTFYAELNYNVRKEEYRKFAETDRLRYTIERAPGVGYADAIVLELPVTGAKNFGSLYVKDARLWNPIGYGTPALYAYKTELIRNGEILDFKTGTIGFRSVDLIEEAIGNDRMSFKLRINGTDVFVKGSNWVPCECFTGETNDEKYRKLIGMAKDAGINMLRVWGGGIYEKDIFYRLCDEYGIMVWQDFMFACADIPEMDADFVRNVEEECVYQVKRLRNHPSLVYWCGGNEKTGSCGLLKQYGDHLVDIVIRGIVDHYDGTRPYVRQSPYSLTDIGNDPESGETHGTSFDIIHLEKYDDFLKTAWNRKVAFASECAVMGSCIPETYRKFVPDDELWPMGEIYEDRFCDNPYGDLMTFVKRQEKAVDLMFGAAGNIDEFAVKSMAVQAEILKIETENLRKNRDICGGLMNWMFSDVWYTGTWSIIDYDCRPKIAYYTLKRVFTPLLAA
ncbi:MAG: glycoside hydrolase family 2 protein, partial [Candidatus Scatosoma sp.]